MPSFGRGLPSPQRRIRPTLRRTELTLIWGRPTTLGSDVMSAAVSASATDLLAKYAENLRWAKSHPDEVGQHRGRYIVVFEGHIVFHSPSRARADAEAKHTPGAYVTYVTPEQWAWIL